MKKTLKYISSLILVTGMCISSLSGQIYSNSADAVRALEFDNVSLESNLFVFYQTNGSYIPGDLSADSPLDSICDITWTKFDEGTLDFSAPVQSDTDVRSSSISALGDGGYKVHITNGSNIDTTWYAWVMLNNLLVTTEKDANGNLESYRSGCGGVNYVIVSGNVEVDTFYYYDGAVKRLYPNDFSILWTSNNPDLTIFNADNKDAMESNYSELPPVIDTWYILTAIDSLGMTDVDSVFYDTKHTKAEFRIEYWDKADTAEIDEERWKESLAPSWSIDQGSMDAPLTARFINLSQNGYEFEWVFLDTVDAETGFSYKENEFSTDSAYVPEYTYYTADKYYYPLLVSKSDAGCIDTFKIDDGIHVAPSELSIPNVFTPPNIFTPNGDGTNDYFVFKHLSIERFKITIVDRRGKLVYRDEVDDIYNWQGWNGNLYNKSTPVPEGQYFFVIEAWGYDNKEYKDPNILQQWKINRQTGGGNTGTGTEEETSSTNMYTGFVYLIREKR